jgi:GDPmannose 4,6-dehydratase
LDLIKKIKFYQASTSEMFGKSPPPQNENTVFQPRSPYAAAKLYSYWVTINYREAYGLFASNGILFNHESPLRGETFVTRKITRAVACILKGKQDKLWLGNLNAKRDWGHAKDYVVGMWKILQHDTPEDFVLASGKSYTVREFCEIAFKEIGINIEWIGEGINELGKDTKSGKVLIEIDKRYFRPTEVDYLEGDASKAKEKLNWIPKISLESMIAEMVQSDIDSFN